MIACLPDVVLEGLAEESVPLDRGLGLVLYGPVEKLVHRDDDGISGRARGSRTLQASGRAPSIPW